MPAYTTSLISNLSKNLKHMTKRKKQFLNKDFLEKYVCSFYCDHNYKMNCRMYKGFEKFHFRFESGVSVTRKQCHL